MRRMAAGILAPCVSKAMRIQLAMATEVAQTSGGGVGGGGSVSGGCGCGLQRDGDADIGGGTHHGRKGTPIANNVCIPVLTLRLGENMRDVLRNMSLPTLGVSVWCKRWHQGGRYFAECEQKVSHIPPTAAALATATAVLEVEHAFS